MTQTPKQWAATGFIIGIASGIAGAFIIFFLMRSESIASAAPPVAPAAAVARATSQSLISGTIDIEPSIASNVKLPAIVFLIARGEGLKGHPVLAKRLDVRSFPVRFALGPQDSMIGQPPPSRVSLEARLDRDGDATTHEPGAPSDLRDAVAIGTQDMTLTLKTQ